ncbi:Copper-sensing transcriptional repressor CsoR [anaerobic digester metagenome]|nr:metal-sensing transcriptional repressor [Clostridiaceae bacterium HFYG-1003]
MSEQVHSHQDTKRIVNRMSRAIGHMESIKRMIEEGRDCSEVLIQLSAVRSAINNVGKLVLADHIKHCVVDAVQSGDDQVLEDLSRAVDKFL